MTPIITVGFSPSWDVTCRVPGIAWGDHKRLSSQTSAPAGKALNISRALARLGARTIAAGLWGAADYPLLRAGLAAESGLIMPRFTVAPGETRRNITVIDTKARREMHLRAECRLASAAVLRRLAADLERLAVRNRRVVFAGSFPAALLDECVDIVRRARDRGARVMVDTSGLALEKTLRLGGLTLIKPNLDELGTALGGAVPDEPGALVEAARSLCEAAHIVLVSRGAAGALAVTREEAWACRAAGRRRVVNTVGCGDYLLAGFLAKRGAGSLREALISGVQVASARAWGVTEQPDWPRKAGKINTILSKC